jgi:hypothetical protein
MWAEAYFCLAFLFLFQQWKKKEQNKDSSSRSSLQQFLTQFIEQTLIEVNFYYTEVNLNTSVTSLHSIAINFNKLEV